MPFTKLALLIGTFTTVVATTIYALVSFDTEKSARKKVSKRAPADENSSR